MKITVLLAALCVVLFASQADARPRHHHHKSSMNGQFEFMRMYASSHVGCSDPVMRPCNVDFSYQQVGRKNRHEAPPGLRRVMAEGAGRAIGRRPRAWCGWQMRKWLGVANPAGNLARWWAGFGRPAHGPRVGAIVVWRHHVGRITGRTADGRWIVKSGNDGHRVRERPRSVANAIAFRWPA